MCNALEYGLLTVAMTCFRVPEECPEEIARLIERCLSEFASDRPSAVQCAQYIDKVR